MTPHGSGAGKDAPGRLRIGTMNLRTFTGNTRKAMAMAEAAELDILLMQETRISQASAPGVQATAKERGWTLHVGGGSWDKAGHPTAGVATLSKWPLGLVKTDFDVPGRVQLMRVHLPNDPQGFHLANLYLQASEPTARADLAKKVLHDAVGRGTQTILMGDWNLTMDQQPLAGYLANGGIHAMDEAHPRWATGDMEPTRKDGRHC